MSNNFSTMIRSLTLCTFFLASSAISANPRLSLEWTFDDAERPLCSRGSQKFEFKSSNPKNLKFIDGIEGKAVSFDGKESPNSLHLPAKDSNWINDHITGGTNSFTVECWFKSDDINFSLLGGNRTVAFGYKSRGWAFGMTQTGALVAVLGNGEARTYSVWSVLRSPYESGQWSHLAFVRDGATCDLRLYVNGIPTPYDDIHRNQKGLIVKESLVTNTFSKGEITIGFDAMTGAYFNGAVDGFRITAGKLSEKEIKKRADLVASHGKAGRFAEGVAPIEVMRPVRPDREPLQIQPLPKKFSQSGKAVEIDSIAIKAENGFAETAGQTLLRKAQQEFALSTNKTSQGLVLSVRIENLSQTDHPEEYRLSGYKKGNVYEVEIKGHSHSAIYAASTLLQLLRTTAINNSLKKAALPEKFDICDWPTMPWRFSVHGWGGELWDRPDFDKFLEETALFRMNAQHHDVQFIKNEEYLKRFCKSADKFGVAVVGWIGYQWHDPITPTRPDTLLKWKADIDMCGRAGVRALSFNFDDLGGKWMSINNETDVKAAYGGRPGRLHNAVVMEGVAFAKKWPKIRKFWACPWMYGKRWEEQDGASYFKDFTRGFKAENIGMWQTVFSKADVERLLTTGNAETYAYYVNGIWPTPHFFRWYMGPERLDWTWNMFTIDRNGVGPVAKKETLAEINTLHKRTDTIFVASSAGTARFLCGVIGWDPAHYDGDRAGRAAAQRDFGSGVWEPLTYYSRAIAPIIAYFKADRTATTIESEPPVIERRVGLTESELNGYKRNLEIAEKAFSEVVAAIDSQKELIDRPWGADRRGILKRDMRKTLDEILEKISLVYRRYKKSSN